MKLCENHCDSEVDSVSSGQNRRNDIKTLLDTPQTLPEVVHVSFAKEEINAVSSEEVILSTSSQVKYEMNEDVIPQTQTEVKSDTNTDKTKQKVRVEEAIEDIVHSFYCCNPSCSRSTCYSIKRFLFHVKLCQKKHRRYDCFLCRQFFSLIRYHAHRCKLALSQCKLIKCGVHVLDYHYHYYNANKLISKVNRPTNYSVHILSQIIHSPIVKSLTNASTSNSSLTTALSQTTSEVPTTEHDEFSLLLPNSSFSSEEDVDVTISNFEEHFESSSNKSGINISIITAIKNEPEDKDSDSSEISQ